MEKEIQNIIDTYKDAYEGHPWFGRSLKELLAEINVDEAIQKPNGEHSILELLYHMINWREFAISRLQPAAGKSSSYFGQNDWVEMDHQDKSLWRTGLEKLDETQHRLIELIGSIKKEKLSEIVAERKYDFTYLLYGVVQHDIYHIGQIAYLKKLLSGG